MNKPRPIAELLKVMLDNQDSFHGGGLCYWTEQLYYDRHISIWEQITLITYIKNNRPSPFSSWDAFKRTGRAFFWKKGNIEPRIKWIKKHIKKLSK